MAIEHDHVTKAPQPAEREGFLPITTNAFDRGFIGVVLFVAIHLLWMRFLEPLGLSLWFATVISLLLAQWIIRKG
jgi:predicted small integral membrane protein